MRKIMIAALSLGLLSGTAALFAAQNTSTDTSTMKSKKHHKKKTKSTDTSTTK
ncbi:MAG TPA: hypothetical protein VGL97_05925 [Bryobacteraceae bacterium]|jgi:hypothetical protein